MMIIQELTIICKVAIDIAAGIIAARSRLFRLQRYYNYPILPNFLYKNSVQSIVQNLPKTYRKTSAEPVAKNPPDCTIIYMI